MTSRSEKSTIQVVRKEDEKNKRQLLWSYIHIRRV